MTGIATIIGGSGFLGAQVLKEFELAGYRCHVPSRDQIPSLKGKQLGVVLFCAGYGRCESVEEKAKVVDGNFNLLSWIMQNCSYERLVYVSSTRIYMGQENTNEDSDCLIGNSDSRKLFNLSKLAAEELCKSDERCFVVRPSNIYGTALSSPLFLPSIARDAIKNKLVRMFVSPDYSKDYVSVVDVATGMLSLAGAEEPLYKIYNVASGENVSAGQIAESLVSSTNCDIEWIENGNDDYFPVTDIRRIKSEFGFSPSSVLDDIDSMVQSFHSAYERGEF